jgi:para-nitrobenzyl esterase
VRDATSFGNECPQRGQGNVIGSEDCLTLNVWAPQSVSASPLPVMVFLHGGGNISGSAQAPVLDGEALAAGNAVVVITLNYRLGVLGFFAAPSLDAESDQNVSGNYGILDQTFALRWVKRNIAAFGGDPKRVLLFGESAGARDVCAQVASALPRELFSAAVMESGNCEETRYLSRMPTLAQAEAEFAPITTAAGCDGASDVAGCLRAVSPEVIVGTLQPMLGAHWEPLANIDGFFLTDTPENLFRAGTHGSHVPIIIGDNADEMALKGLAPNIPDAVTYRDTVAAIFGASNVREITAQYPAAAYATPFDAFVTLWSDEQFICPARRYARALALGQTQSVHRYLFSDGRGVDQRAVHGAELAFVFGNFKGNSPTASDLDLAAEIERYWTRLASTGDPNGSDPIWPRYRPVTDPYLDLDTHTASATGLRTAHCDFWDLLQP